MIILKSSTLFNYLWSVSEHRPCHWITKTTYIVVCFVFDSVGRGDGGGDRRYKTNIRQIRNQSASHWTITGTDISS